VDNSVEKLGAQEGAAKVSARLSPLPNNWAETLTI
jgi:hypothetical protein